ncbi:response regulator [Nitrogeniibacter aestuarii]|uniref:response regulator n=1 Tax=Nitrogeniibacter aestuarii TaxID=2815343 RepID=UPI001D0FE671|nr:response regulator [Nitrogeniibacter aestuarii]
MNVFIVEDNPLNAELAVKLLEDEGARVRQFSMAEDALEALREEVPDIVLLDMNLPGMNGYEAARQIGRDARTHHVPVVAFTAMALSGEADRAIQCGCCGVIYKPIDVLSFTSTVRGFILPGGQQEPMAPASGAQQASTDNSRALAFHAEHSISADQRVEQLAHTTMNQISILKSGIYYLLHSKSSSEQLTEKQRRTLLEMEKAMDVLRDKNRFMIDIVAKRVE